MPVYVDELIFGPFKMYQREVYMCHLTADTLDELHAMADQIGLKRRWFQGPPQHSVPHYDLVDARRNAALLNGAIFKPAREQAKERLDTRHSA